MSHGAGEDKDTIEEEDTMTGTDHGSSGPATSRAFFGILTKVVVLAIMAVGLTAPYGYAGPPTDAMKTTIDEVLHIIHEKELKQPAKSEERDRKSVV